MKKLKKLAKKEKKRRREMRDKLEEELGEDAPARKEPKTIETMREKDETTIKNNDEDLIEDVLNDEFASYFSSNIPPKILITTNLHSTTVAKYFIKDLLKIIPNSQYCPRKKLPLKKIVEFSKTRGFTDIIVINEDQKILNSLLLCHLPKGPTAMFKLSSVKLNKEIKNHARFGDYYPELILNNFDTRLGHTIGRMLSALFPQKPEFTGRQVVTFHNQRDFIFVRHHRYIFDDSKTARLQEIGPQFTLKLRYIQHGTFDSLAEYEWLPKVYSLSVCSANLLTSLIRKKQKLEKGDLIYKTINSISCNLRLKSSRSQFNYILT